ncbi:hypothetical protein Q7267_08025 [Glaesserella parasuis]|uniref:hypothetical protein n=1 Tax=Glaesserella parasuis TaxID=738 RepID=UPI0024363820|nr:hypothetical protein [Glaesserella parasuis]MDG6828703.1 hypothetical protein [Glaesserella parasuis]MDO9926604.1 hypothetical protein [Glaesserella parasuis]MDO9930124.1 hypothetical protein [Glaesserella parasuis]MDO9982242.1 hypothetical protein [Glaesserella parasuis]MDP0128715.1 hypothetical protein [Glaesserella parasuis]
MSDFVKAIPFFAEFAKKEGPEALANFFEFIAANSEVEPEGEGISEEKSPVKTELETPNETIPPILLVQTSESLSEADKLWVEQTFDRVCKVMSPEDSIRLRAILITMKTILSRMTLLYSHSCQLAALLFQSRLLLRPLPVDSHEVRSHKLALIEECERVSLEPSRRFL